MVMKFIPNNVKPKLCNELYRFGLPVEGNNEQVQQEASVKEDSMQEDCVQENSVQEDSTIYDNRYLKKWQLIKISPLKIYTI